MVMEIGVGRWEVGAGREALWQCGPCYVWRKINTPRRSDVEEHRVIYYWCLSPVLDLANWGPFLHTWYLQPSDTVLSLIVP